MNADILYAGKFGNTREDEGWIADSAGFPVYGIDAVDADPAGFDGMDRDTIPPIVDLIKDRQATNGLVTPTSMRDRPVGGSANAGRGKLA